MRVFFGHNGKQFFTELHNFFVGVVRLSRVAFSDFVFFRFELVFYLLCKVLFRRGNELVRRLADCAGNAYVAAVINSCAALDDVFYAHAVHCALRYVQANFVFENSV